MAHQKAKKRASKQIKSRKKRSVFAYPVIIFLLLCAGVFLVAWTFRAGADNILVTAKVAAQPVTSPATITAPPGGAHFSSIPIAVAGSCPANAAYVKIFDNNVMRGVAICNAGGHFTLMADLFPGTNSLIARVFNSTDDEGPVSATVTVYYDLPKQGHPPTSTQNPLILETAFVYKGFHVGSQVDWPVGLSGGTGPYAVNVDWGDGNADLISQSQPGQFTISHTYNQAGDYKNSYTVKIKATDSNGQAAYLQFFVIVTQDVVQAGNIFSKPTPTINNGLNWLWFAWPLYIIILLMAISYKLGEKEEVIVLRKRGLLRHGS